jgi:hypothetical protein
VKLFTVTTVDMANGVARRLYTSDPESYPSPACLTIQAVNRKAAKPFWLADPVVASKWQRIAGIGPTRAAADPVERRSGVGR